MCGSRRTEHWCPPVPRRRGNEIASGSLVRLHPSDRAVKIRAAEPLVFAVYHLSIMARELRKEYYAKIEQA
jgi:hypothetical protein